MKHQAIVGNIGHFDNEIDMAGLARVPGIVKDNIKPQVDQWIFPDGHGIIILSEGRLLNLGNATGHPSFVMSNSFSNQVLAQIELFTHNDKYEDQVYLLPKHLDEKIARVHVEALGAQLTTMTPEQSAYVNVPVDGPVQVGPLPLLKSTAHLLARLNVSSGSGKPDTVLSSSERAHGSGALRPPPPFTAPLVPRCALTSGATPRDELSRRLRLGRPKTVTVANALCGYGRMQRPPERCRPGTDSAHDQDR